MLTSKTKMPPSLEMLARAIEHLLPLLEAHEVVERVEDAEHDVEALAEIEARHVLVEEPRLWDLLRGDLEHLSREIEARESVSRGSSCSRIAPVPHASSSTVLARGWCFSISSRTYAPSRPRSPITSS